MRFLYCTCALFALLASTSTAAQEQGTAETRGFTVFVRGVPIGREDVTVRQSAAGLVISAHGRLAQPVDLITRRAEVRYRSDWTPESLEIESSLKGRDVVLKTTFENGVARSEGSDGGTPLSKTDTVAPQTVVLPNLFFGSYEALARKLADAAPGSELRAYIAPQAEIGVRLQSVSTNRIQTASETFDVRRYELVFLNPGGELAVHLSADERGRLVRVTVPSQALDVIRDDVAAATARTQVYSNPGDETARIPGNGFTIAATLTRPKGAAGRLPAIVLLTGANVGDRDGMVAGVPMMGQLAGALADAGFLAVRFDKRGYGQTGGRAESATLGDFAEDARTIVRWLADRKDVDPRRIAVLGHAEGAWAALLAAAREKRIAAVIALAAAGSTGAELVLEQQRHALESAKVPEAERKAKVELQQKINTAVLGSGSWEGVPEPLRKQADTAWFQSILAFDPADVLEDVRQPLLVVHGEVDRQVPVSHAERLANLARKESDSPSVELATVRGVNHLLVPATTGETAEYESLEDRNVSADVTKAVIGWLQKVLAATRRR